MNRFLSIVIFYVFLLQENDTHGQSLAAFDDCQGVKLYETKIINVLSNDICPENAKLKILGYTNNTQISTPPEAIDGNRIKIIRPHAIGNDQIEYSLCDGESCDTAIVNVIVRTGFFPHAIRDIYVMKEWGPVDFYVLRNDIIAGASHLEIVSMPRYGTAQATGEKIAYSPSTSFSVDSLEYRICQGQICSEDWVVIYYFHPPVIADIHIDVPEGTEYAFSYSDFAGAFEDKQDGILTGIKIKKLPVNGDLFINGIRPDEYSDRKRLVIKASDIDLLVYKPDDDFIGQDVFEWQSFSGARASNIAKAKINVVPVPEQLVFYEGFSPNGDLSNDRWIIEGIQDYPDNQLKIFNRYGILVFEIDNYDNLSRFWSGETNVTHFNPEHIAPNDVYFYQLKLNSGKSIKGSIVLKR